MHSSTTTTMILLGLFVLACGDRSLTPAERQRLAALSPPHYTDSDFPNEQRAQLYDVSLSETPPFYRGDTPLSFVRGQTPDGGMYSPPRTVLYQFPAFTTIFVGSASGIWGARTTDKRGVLKAEARVRYFRDGSRQGIEVEEFHYDPAGVLVFYCKSAIDPDSGFKVKETNTIGRKKSEYYFIWPTD